MFCNLQSSVLRLEEEEEKTPDLVMTSQKQTRESSGQPYTESVAKSVTNKSFYEI